MSIKNGGPAFPNNVFIPHPGMTLRDYFATAAMQALITGPERKAFHYDHDLNEAICDRAYIIADTMLESRERM